MLVSRFLERRNEDVRKFNGRVYFVLCACVVLYA